MNIAPFCKVRNKKVIDIKLKARKIVNLGFIMYFLASKLAKLLQFVGFEPRGIGPDTKG